MGNLLMECIFSFLRSSDMEKGSAYRKQFVDECVTGFLAEAQSVLAGTIDARHYCQCMIEKLISDESLSKNFFKQADDKNSMLMNEAVLPCLLEAIDTSDLRENGEETRLAEKTDEGMEADAGIPDVKGEVVSQEIMLTKYLNTYRLKVRIGGLEKSFILDSGASDVLISKDFEKELLAAGLLKKTDYIGEKIYLLADGRKVKGKVYLLNGMQVGGFTIDNVAVGVLSEDASLLLGKSFLDKFRKWHIDNERKTLYLER